MASTARINVVSGITREYSSNIVVDDITYHVQTEDMAKAYKIVTRIYRKGEVVFSRDADYSHLAQHKNLKAKRNLLLESQHKTTISLFMQEQAEKQKLKPEFFKEVQLLMKRGNGRSAMKVLEDALERFPNDPFLLSYYGCLTAVVENKPNEGIRICKDAIGRLDNSMPFGGEFFYPVFYLNLGRAYLKGGNKHEAVSCFNEGLRIDPENRDVNWEMKRLGMRKRPPLPFLKRSNPINKYIGMLRSKVSR